MSQEGWVRVACPAEMEDEAEAAGCKAETGAFFPGIS